ncbi:unnamed protein product [Paramecium primaurelia]|uniref:Uncharacterized protein n=1 Tax=Paramecium primaurelia TaxID=5886 RepID=A0A8S1KYZ5_PARPR|nr:unnamed protein product [Paramecium primaurelia]
MQENRKQILKSQTSDRSIKNAANTITKITNKKIQQLAFLTQFPQQRKYTVVEKVNKLIDKTQSKLKNQQIPKDVQFYKRNMKKFENLSSFINSKGLLSANFSMPKLRVKEKVNEQEHEYVDYLLAKNYKLQQERQRRKSKQVKEDYEQCWELENSDYDYESPINVGKELKIAHQDQLKGEIEAKAKLWEFQQIRKYKRKITNIELKSSLRSSQHNVEDNDEIVEDTAHLNALHYKEQSDKVIKMIWNAAKKIYNKKQDQIKKEILMHQIAKNYRQKQREMAKEEINKILITGQKQHLTFAKTVRHLPENGDSKQNTEQYFRKKGQTSRKIQVPFSFSPQNLQEDIKSNRKITQINSRLHDIVNQIDNIPVGDQTQTIRKMQSEQILYQTLRETLQPDQIKDTLKGLFLPTDHLYKRRLQYNKKHFQNQIL